MKRILLAVLIALCLPALAQTPLQPLYFPVFRALDSNGKPLNGGKLFSYAAGTTTPLATFTDATSGTPNTNPVVLDSTGTAKIFLSNSTYKFVLQNQFGVQQWTIDNISGVAAASIVVNPSGNQTIIQPGNTSLSVNAINKSFYASLYPGADVGAQINAADTAAGAGNADIWVTLPGTVSSIPTISSNHRLILAAPLTWSTGINLQSNTQVEGSGNNAVQTVTLTTGTAWTLIKNVSNVTLDNVWFVNNGAVTDQNSYIFLCQTCSNIFITNNNVFAATLVSTTTTALTYAEVTSESQLSSNIMISGNYINGNNNPISGAFILYTKGVVFSNNYIINAEDGFEWWGGDAAIEGLTLTNPRWARDITVTNSTAINVRAGFWGDMGQDINVTGVTVDGCSDVCLDAESSTRVVFSGFSVKESVNGALATFFSSLDVEFGPGVVESSSASAQHLAFFHNASFSPLGAQRIKVHNVKFNCTDPASDCILGIDPQGGFEFSNNELFNSVLVGQGANNSGYRITGNTFKDTFTLTSPANIIIPGQTFEYSIVSAIEGNFFTSTVFQPAGKFAIQATITDPNAPDQLMVTNNRTNAFTNDAQFIAQSTNAGISPIFMFDGNVWGGNSVTDTIAGTLGTFIGNNYNASTDSTVFTGPLGMGGLVNGKGLQMVSVSPPSVCTPSNTMMAQCTSLVTLPIAEADAGYVMVCNARGANVFVGSTKNYTPTTFQIDIYASATAAPSVDSISCLVTHP